jgi:hypothetical protein
MSNTRRESTPVELEAIIEVSAADLAHLQAAASRAVRSSFSTIAGNSKEGLWQRQQSHQQQ